MEDRVNKSQKDMSEGPGSFMAPGANVAGDLDLGGAEKRVVIMRGLPGSGKSTKSRAYGGTIVSADDYFMQDGEYVFDPVKLPQAHAKCRQQFEEALKRGDPLVVVDNTNIQEGQYEPYKEMAERYGYSVDVDAVGDATPSALLPQQQSVRNIHSVPSDAIKKMLDKWEGDPHSPYVGQAVAAKEMPVFQAEDYFSPEVLEKIWENNKRLWNDTVEGMALQAMIKLQEWNRALWDESKAAEAVARAYGTGDVKTVYETPIMKAVLDQVLQWMKNGETTASIKSRISKKADESTYHGDRRKGLDISSIDDYVFVNCNEGQVEGYTLDEDGEVYTAEGKIFGQIYKIEFNPKNILDKESVESLPNDKLSQEFKKEYVEERDFDPNNNPQHKAWFDNLVRLGFDFVDTTYINLGDGCILNARKNIESIAPSGTWQPKMPEYDKQADAKICAWCGKRMGEEMMSDPRFPDTHGMCHTCFGREMKKTMDRMQTTSAIDDGGIGSREMDPNDISVQHKRPELEPLWPGDAKEQNQGVSRMKEDPTAIDPVVTDQRGSDSDEWFQKTRYPAGPSHHRMQITTAPEDPQISDPVTAALFKKAAEEAKKVEPLLFEKVRFPGSDEHPLRKSVPTGEGGVIGIPGVDGSSTHVVTDAEEEKPADVFKSGQPASNTVVDEFVYPNVQRGQGTRQVGPYQFAAKELFNPINGDDLLLDL